MILSSNAYGDFIKISVDGEYCDIRFLDTGTITRVTNNNAKFGRVKDKNRPTVFGVGFIGYGEHSSTLKAYRVWANMIKRCYSESARDATYRDCTVCDDWHNYQKFASWYYDNCSEDDDLEIDKDIMVKGNRLYSPETCMMVSGIINRQEKSKRLQRNNSSGFIGVTRNRKSGTWIARCTINGERIVVGSFKCAKSASDARRDFIDQMAQRDDRIKEYLEK